MPTQLGGGIRTIENIARWLEAGVKRVILGTVAVKEPGLVKAACKQWPGQIAVGIDARDGMVAVDGWTEAEHGRARSTSRCVSRTPASPPSSTPTSTATAPWAASMSTPPSRSPSVCTTPVIASGGVRSLDDLRELRPAEDDGIAGAIVGRALYDGRVTVPDAIRVLKGD